ncbi:MAG: NlpC/P60 family protein, partial [Nocardioidaceae bacterium]
YRHVRHIRKKNIKRGDLMFFSNGGGVYHVGIYLGRARDGRALMLHSPYPGQRVHRERVWTSHWSAGTLRLR